MSWDILKKHALEDCLTCNGYSPAECEACQSWLKRIWMYSPSSLEAFELIGKVDKHFLLKGRFNVNAPFNLIDDGLFTWEDYENE